MRAMCVSDFFDKDAKTMRFVGDEFECSEKRFEKINGTKYGVLVAEVREEIPEEKPIEPSQVEDPEPYREIEESVNKARDNERRHRGRRGYRD